MGEMLSGVLVKGLGLGLAALGRPAYINLEHGDDLERAGGRSVTTMEAHAHRVLDAAWEGSIRYIDAARSYGRAEEFLATWLSSRHLARTDIVVGSKWGYTYVGDWRTEAEVHEVKDHRLPALKQQYAESCALLGDHLALYQIHSATLESGVLQDKQVLDELASLRDSGLLIGVTTSGPRQAEVISQALEIERGDAPLFAAVQVTWNPLDPSVETAAIAANSAGVAVIVKEALANGRLTEKAGFPAGTASRVLATALAKPWSTIVLSGAATVAQLEANLAGRDAPPLTAEDLASLEISPVEPERYWAERSTLQWN
jgi:aryl-alcohol dehydrogenase-like predicted oxidoreductase